jgi:hypothetical protein
MATPHSPHGLPMFIDARLDSPRECGYHEAQHACQETPQTLKPDATAQLTRLEIVILRHGGRHDALAQRLSCA